MRKNILITIGCVLAMVCRAQDTLKSTTTLKEVVVTGTRFEVPLEKSGKTIFKLEGKDIDANAGKTLADLLNEVPGLQTDGNFGTPGSNLNYYVRGGRNKNTLILIDGVPLSDPSSINLDYDLRYIPVSQIESVEVLKGGLSTLYGTSAAAGVINIRLKEPGKKFSGRADAEVSSYQTFAQNIHAGGSAGNLLYFAAINNITSEGFSSAQDNDPAITFDKDGFSRQNALVKLGYVFTPAFRLDVQSAYEKFDADYDAYEFADAPNTQTFSQFRLGVNPKVSLGSGELEGRFFFNKNHRQFFSDFPDDLRGSNMQGEVLHRHRFSEQAQVLWGLNYHRMAYDQAGANSADTTNFSMLDPYASVMFVTHAGLTLHAGLRLNTHSAYGSKLVYNVNPSWLLNENGAWRYKVIASVASSYITPSLYHIYSIYGNKDLNPEQSVNYEAGVSAYHGSVTINAAIFARNETDPIDFVSLFDDEGNFLGGRYQNIPVERMVRGVELNGDYVINRNVAVSAHYTLMNTDKPETFYKIPKTKYGAAINWQPFPDATFSLKYNYTGRRTSFDFATFSEISLESYQLVDVYASYAILTDTFTVYGGINNLFDEQFVALYGYTTRGRNFSFGVRYSF